MQNRRDNHESCVFHSGHGSRNLSDSNAADDNFPKKIQSQFLQDFLYYIPYAVLSAMTIPAVFYATADVPSAILATIAAILLAWKGLPLIVVALAASGTAFLTALIEKLFF